jgi:hypothetical protein
MNSLIPDPKALHIQVTTNEMRESIHMLQAKILPTTSHQTPSVLGKV